ncbi:Imm50 family immunity protein [Streptomyces sp. NPDC051636]|uniref:Imm50 family immunity protein n=1 Tax=Streptomyces sp. NPDC051636 TaxID=3365663 RepID=UPI0037B44FCB
MSGEWKRLFASSSFLGALYGDSPPSPDECNLFYVHLDERGRSVTLGFETRNLPETRPEDWVAKGFNALEFYLVFTDVQGIQVTGWGAAQAKEKSLVKGEGTSFEVVLGTTASGITFRSPAAALTRTHAYLASDSP